MVLDLVEEGEEEIDVGLRAGVDDAAGRFVGEGEGKGFGGRGEVGEPREPNVRLPCQTGLQRHPKVKLHGAIICARGCYGGFGEHTCPIEAVAGPRGSSLDCQITGISTAHCYECLSPN